MIVPSSDEIEHEPSLIEDVVMPHAEQFTDASKDMVRHRSVGNLQQQYVRSQKKELNIPSTYHPSKIRYSNYTVVPPLQTLPDLYSATSKLPLLYAVSKLAGNIQNQLTKAKLWGVGLLLTLRKRLTYWAPKRYTASRGLVTDWRAALFRARILTPIVLVIFILSYRLWPSDNSIPQYPENTTQHASTANATSSAANNSATSNPTDPDKSNGNSKTAQIQSNPSATSKITPSQAPSALTPLPAPISTSPSPISGGRGGGNATPALSNPTLPLNLTLTVPPASIPPDGKPVIDTTGGSTTIN